ncbi:FG-GAP-like repeat-containing protein [Candidatus Palauibacter sp.]|uniref:FG-GAP-like repeat-containing protein n=1 Tax=Candidatus Palauibacter sp. TaxID=3101350 RepID=UPI003AF2DBAA
MAARPSGLRALLSPTIGVVFFGACENSPPPVSIDWIEGDGARERALRFEGEPGGGFTRLSADRTGITATPSVSREARLANRTLIHGVGVALGDVDGDGWVDLYLCMLDRPNVLYRNLGGWRFEDVTGRSGTALADRLSRGAVLADADGDGDLDLMVAVHGGTNALLLNDGSGVFEEGDAGFGGAWGSSTVALADVDGDEDLDAYFANYKTIQGDDLFSPEERSLRGLAERVGDELVVAPPYDAHYRMRLEGERALRFELADPDEFYLNDGSGRFEPVDLGGGAFRSADGEAVTEVPREWGLAARFFDADDDGDADLFVANDLGSRDGFWLNEGGIFVAASGLAFRTESTSSMGVDFSDIDGDGDTDFVTTEMLARDPVRRREQVSLGVAGWTPPGEHAARMSADRNTLHLNRGDGTWAETARAAGLDASEWTWGAMFLDVDLDGYEDLLITNGHGWDPLDGDTQEALRTGRIQVDWREELGVFPPLRLRNLAFRNRGDGTFGEMGRTWGYGVEPDVSHGIAAADFDRDGDRDVVITRLDEPPLVLRNDAGGVRVALRVRGEGGNTQAIGARVVLAAGGALPAQTRQVTSGGLYLSGSDPGLTFAMGERAAAEATIVWPSGRRRTLRVSANRAYEVAPPGDAAGGEPGMRRPAGAGGGPALFAGPEAVGRHGESAFDELARQPLVPLELSRSGPGVAWADIDADGDPDLLVGAGAGGRAQLAINEAGRLVDPVPFGAPAVGDHTSILALPTAARPVILAGVSSWEARSPADLDAIPPLARLDAGPPPAVPPSTHATGPLAAADVDGDGDLDLFVGARATPGAYPRPADSRLLLADGDAWTVDATAAATLRGIGLVSGAVFSDVDGDGDPDLALALEWGPVRLLENDGGRFTDVTDAWGPGAHTGRWNGIATGDFDGDGRSDLVVTAWGDNTGLGATADRPVGVVASDLDGNGLVDLIEVETGQDGVARPVRDYLTLGRALPFLRRAAPTFEAFARASVDDLLGSGRTGLYRPSAATLRHTVFLNRPGEPGNGGGFEARPLPARAQVAPAFGVAVADFDRDGHEDLFLAQNYLATPRGLPRYDAGRGVVLLGDGRGGFRALEVDESGVTVYGDARAAALADFDADGRWDLAVGQNGAETLIFRGRGGPPGLRVRLSAGGGSPGAIGARLRPRYRDGAEGPAREIQAGSGYWSLNGPVQVFGRAADIRAVTVRWADGTEEVFEVETGALEVKLRRGEGS